MEKIKYKDGVDQLMDYICPERDKLILDSEGTFHATIFDQELDPIKCSFLYDGGVEIDTENLKWINLSLENLYQLIEMIEEAEECYENQDINEEI